MPLHSKNIGDVQPFTDQDPINETDSHLNEEVNNTIIDLNRDPIVIANITVPMTADAETQPTQRFEGEEENKKTMVSGSIKIKGLM